MRWLIACVLAGASLAVAATASAQESVTVSGTLVSGTAEAPFDARSVPVTLTVLEGVTSLDERTAIPAADGTFTFDAVASASGRTYFLTAEYQGAVYSVTPTREALGQPVSLQVFEATSNTDILEIESHSLVVTGVVRRTRTVEVLELVRVRNTSDRTLVPELGASGPAMLGFLRFALPPGASRLDVRSNLVGGQVLEVDLGFAVTTPIPPTANGAAGAHSFEFVYQVPYTGSSLDLGRTMRFGAGAMRAVVPADVGVLRSTQLTDLGSIPAGAGTSAVNGRAMQLLEGAHIARGARVDLVLDRLPAPTLADRLSRDAQTWTALVAVPTLVALALGALLLLGLRRRRDLATVEGPATGEARLWEHLEALEARRAAGMITPRAYQDGRSALREALIESELGRHFGRPES